MKCPECGVEVEQPSGWAAVSTTLGAWPHRYHDEEGKYHHHNPNTLSQTLSCSNGHFLEMVFKERCPSCDNNADHETKVRLFYHREWNDVELAGDKVSTRIKILEQFVRDFLALQLDVVNEEEVGAWGYQDLQLKAKELLKP